MKLETFFEKFDQFADAPDAVAKMRELVLLLAVQGKLVDQLSGDEPATKLLERIQKSKERLIQERAIRRQETDSIDCDSAPFPIPQSWVWSRLGEIGDWGSGSTPPRGSHDLYDGGITWLKSGELNDNLALAGSSETVTELALKTGSFRRNQPGDVLFAMYGATIGKAAILAEPAVTNQAVCGCTPFEGVSNRYLFNYLLSQRAAFHEASEGGAQPNLSKVKIVAFPFPLPPLAEQKRIVAKVDELMALCDRLALQQQERETRHAALARASLARFADAPTVSNLKFLFHESYSIPPADLRKAILALAIDGSFIKAGSKETQFGEVIDLLGGYAFKSEWFTKSSGIRLVRNQNISHGDLDWSETEYLSNDRAPEFEKWALRPGDLVLSLNRPFISTGLKLAWITDADCPCLLVQRIVCLRPDPQRLLAKYLYLWCNAPHFYRDAHVVPSSGVPYIAPHRVAQMKMRLPPLAEQRRIVAKVEQMMALVDALETQLAASRATAANLLSALVAELTGTHNNGKVSVPSASTTGRRGRPRKST